MFVTNAGGPLGVGRRHEPAARRCARCGCAVRSGGIALSANGDRAVVGPGRRSRKAIVLNTSGRARARRISAGKGPSFVAFSPTAARIYVANSGSGTVTFASGYTYRRLSGRVRVGRRINGMAAQSGYSPDHRHSRAGHAQGRPRL